MADIAHSSDWITLPPGPRPRWLVRLIRRVRIARRHARRARYLAVTSRAPRRYDWVAELARATGGRF